MNKIVLLGRIIRDPELRHTENNDKVYTKFILAVQRNFTLPNGIREADFIQIVAWGKKAEAIVKYMRKGSLITLSGRLRTDRYDDKDGNKKYIAEVVAEDFKFLDSKKSETQAL